MQKDYNLSKNQQIIFDIIYNSSEPLKAYSILFNVQKKGIKAPLQVYRALDNRVFRWIAKLSFSVYLWHMVFIVFIERKAAKNYVYNGVTDTSEWVVLSCIVLAGSICIAALSWRFLESPVLQYARKAPHLSRK